MDLASALFGGPGHILQHVKSYRRIGVGLLTRLVRRSLEHPRSQNPKGGKELRPTATSDRVGMPTSGND